MTVIPSKLAVLAFGMAEVEPRLYVNAVFTSFRRNKRNINPNQALLKIDGVNSKEEAAFYVGKKVAAPYKGTDKSKDFNYGTVTQAHGNSGIVRAKFDRNLPPALIGTQVRVFLIPSTI
jgi:large subunit ribosomal protein L35Ae